MSTCFNLQGTPDGWSYWYQAIRKCQIKVTVHSADFIYLWCDLRVNSTLLECVVE